MFITTAIRGLTGITALDIATKRLEDKNIITGKLEKESEKMRGDNKSLLIPNTGKSIDKLGFTFWDTHKLSIISSLVTCSLALAFIIFEIYSPSSRVWVIAGSTSLLFVDLMGYKLNIRQLEHKIKEKLSEHKKDAEKEVDGTL